MAGVGASSPMKWRCCYSPLRIPVRLSLPPLSFPAKTSPAPSGWIQGGVGAGPDSLLAVLKDMG